MSSRLTQIALAIMAALAIALSGSDAYAQRRATTRRHLKPDAAMTQKANTLRLDTIACAPADLVVSGYDKPTRSIYESAFFTNKTTATITHLIMHLTYYDTQGRMLHRQRVAVNADLPAGDTRNIRWRSWDRQQSFHYLKSRSARGSASTPYSVECVVDSLIVAVE